MGDRHTWSSLAGVAVVALLALLQLEMAVARPGLPAYAAVVLLVSGVATGAAALELRRHNSFVSRLGAVVAASVAVGGAALSATVGLPGAASAGVSPWGCAVAVLGLAVILLVVGDVRSRHTRPDYLSPYDE
jgi:hypothetical protein